MSRISIVASSQGDLIFSNVDLDSIFDLKLNLQGENEQGLLDAALDESSRIGIARLLGLNETEHSEPFLFQINVSENSREDQIIGFEAIAVKEFSLHDHLILREFQSIAVSTAIIFSDPAGQILWKNHPADEICDWGSSIPSNVWSEIGKLFIDKPIRNFNLSSIGYPILIDVHKISYPNVFYCLELRPTEDEVLQRSRDIMRSFGHEGAGPMIALRDDILPRLSEKMHDGDFDEFKKIYAHARLLVKHSLAQLHAYQFLGGAEPQWTKTENVDIFLAVQEVFPFLYRENLPFEFDFGEGDIVCSTDRMKFSLIIRNVLENAIEAMEKVEERTSSGLVSAKLDGDWLIINITDNGHGSELDSVYEEGVTSKDNSEGLGLVIAKGFVDCSGGQLEHYFTPNCGCSVIIHLPST